MNTSAEKPSLDKIKHLTYPIGECRGSYSFPIYAFDRRTNRYIIFLSYYDRAMTIDENEIVLLYNTSSSKVNALYSDFINKKIDLANYEQVICSYESTMSKVKAILNAPESIREIKATYNVFTLNIIFCTDTVALWMSSDGVKICEYSTERYSPYPCVEMAISNAQSALDKHLEFLKMPISYVRKKKK